MFEELLGKYSLILRFTQASSLDEKLISDLLSMVGISVPDSIMSRVVQIVNGLSAEKGYKNLLQVAQDPEFAATVITLYKEYTARVAKAEEELLALPQIDVDSVVKCPHCRRAFSLIDAPGLKEKLDI